MNTSLVITTGARLHFGPFSYGCATPPFFGGVGLMIDSPRFVVEFRHSDYDTIEQPREYNSRATQFIELCRERSESASRSPGIHVTIREYIPRHAGFGSGTQLALAIASGFAALNAGAGNNVECHAKLVGRGRRSAIGIHGFKLGGFLIDAGKNSEHEIGSLAAESPLPDEWRFVLITPNDEAGLSGDDETAAFEQLAPMPSSTTECLHRLAMAELLPSVWNSDFSRFSEALFVFGNTVGEYFSPVQGGVIRHPGMRALVGILRRDGVKGIAQTSWGPTICVAAECEADANRLAATLRDSPPCQDCSIQVARPRNTGAEIVST